MIKIPENKWLYLFLLSLIWGSSYILIKRGLVGLSPIELGSARIVISTVFLLVLGFNSLSGLSRYHWKWLIITGFLGTFFPSFFFAFAQLHIDSSVAAILNSLTPIFTVLVGITLFATRMLARQELLQQAKGLVTSPSYGICRFFRFSLGRSTNQPQSTHWLCIAYHKRINVLCNQYSFSQT